MSHELIVARAMTDQIQQLVKEVRTWVLSTWHTDIELSKLSGLSQRCFWRIRTTPEWDPHASTLDKLIPLMLADKEFEEAERVKIAFANLGPLLCDNCGTAPRWDIFPLCFDCYQAWREEAKNEVAALEVSA
jgi:hypothetical protein